MPKIICNGARNKGFFGADDVVITGMKIGGEKMSRCIKEQMPAVDVAEIVQCKYCKHHGEATQSGMVYCPQFAGGSVSENSFCSMWERR